MVYGRSQLQTCSSSCRRRLLLGRSKSFWGLFWVRLLLELYPLYREEVLWWGKYENGNPNIKENDKSRIRKATITELGTTTTRTTSNDGIAVVLTKWIGQNGVKLQHDHNNNHFFYNEYPTVVQRWTRITHATRLPYGRTTSAILWPITRHASCSAHAYAANTIASTGIATSIHGF